MKPTDIVRASIWEDTDATFLARARIDSSNTFVPLRQSDVASIAYKVFTGGLQVGSTGTPTVSNVIYDALQTGSIWTVDTTGFNFKCVVPATYFPDGDKVYRVEFRITLTGGTSFPLVYEVTAANLLGS